MKGVFRLAALAFLLLPAARAHSRTDLNELKPLIDVIELVQKNYAANEGYTTQALADKAIAGMVSNLDRYSEFLDRQKYMDVQEDTRGSFSGIGIEIGVVDGRLSVIAPIDGTPADRAGLKSGDEIAYIEGVPTDDMNIMEAVHRIKGPTGTTVVLTIFREGEPPRDVSIERDKITPINIRERLLGDIGYVTLRNFSLRASKELYETLVRFDETSVTGVILDLRSNPGGLLEQAGLVADLFMPGGKEIVSTEGRDARQEKKYVSHQDPYFDMPLVVLTDEHSASGSEIVAGALKDWGRAIIVGRRTFGKGSVQSIEPITADGARALRITVAHYYTPRHGEIDGVGVEPDVALPVRHFPLAVRRMEREGVFKRYVKILIEEASRARPGHRIRLDAEALAGGLVDIKAGKGRPALDEDDVDRRLRKDFHSWATANVTWFPDEKWNDMNELVGERLRVAVMREVKGEEAARRLAVEFDPQVLIAADLLRLSGSPSP